MPNHFHILVKEIKEGGVTKFMGKLTTGYSMYFNKTHKRVGPLFQGRFKAEHVDRDEYLKYLYAYIHLNPVKLIDPKWKENGIADKAGAKAYLDGYRYSSYPDYAGVSREEKAILSPREFPEYFEKPHDMEEFISDWLSYGDEDDNEDEEFDESLEDKEATFP
jgi:putative transposase